MPKPFDLPTVKVNVFPGGFNWGLYTGIDKQFFDKEGLRLEVLDTPNSMAQMTGLAAGRFEIAMTGVDNVVAYREGQGEAPIGPQPEFFAFMGSDSAFLSLVCAPEFSDVKQLKGEMLAVDALTTGYAFVLYEILRRNGLNPGSYGLRRVGGMIQRLNSLSRGNEAATLFSAPYNLIAKSRGFRQLVTATAALGPYQGNVAAAGRGWAERNSEKIVAYIRGYRRAIDWLYDPVNRAEAIEILLRNVPNLSRELGENCAAELLAPVGGFFRDCAIDIEGLRCVLQLRSRYAEPQKDLSDPRKYYDPTYFETARTLVRT